MSSATQDTLFAFMRSLATTGHNVHCPNVDTFMHATVIIRLSFPMLPLSHTQTGDPEKNEKVAFVLLVKLLTKRTVNNPLIYIYEEC